MRILRLIIAVVLSVFLFERIASLDQYVGPPLYRPLHFLGFLVTGVVIYLVLLPKKKRVWTRRDSTFVTASAFTAAAVWVYEFLFSYQVSHLGGIMIYMIPLAVFILGRWITMSKGDA
jgi:hypothetical protein